LSGCPYYGAVVFILEDFNMKVKYYGSVSDDTGCTLFESGYTTKHEALKNLCHEAKKAARYSRDYLVVCVTLFHGDRIIASGEVSATKTRLRWLSHNPLGLASLPVSGVRIC
jgi:hypothetical protein